MNVKALREAASNKGQTFSAKGTCPKVAAANISKWGTSNGGALRR